MDLLILPPKFQAFDGNGAPLASGKVYTYAAGTETNETTYSDYALTTPNANPVVLNSRGEAVIHCANALKLVLKDSEDSTIWTVDNVTPIQKSVFAAVNTSLAGCLVRPLFEYKDADEIEIGSGVYHHQGTTEQIVYWDSKLTFQLSGVGTEEWHYIYIDDSAIITAGTNLLTASEFTHSTTAPTWSASKHGWYNGSDRCIFAVYIDTSGNIEEFFHGNDFVFFAAQMADLEATDIDTTWTDVTLTIPAFAIKASCAFLMADSDDGVNHTVGFWRTNGQTEDYGHTYGNHKQNLLESNTSQDVLTDSSQIIEIKHSRSDATTTNIQTHGWYFPIGM